jgi:hypothetical protein
VSVEQLAFVLVVRSAAELDVAYRGLAPDAMRVDVMELGKGCRVATAPTPAHESAGSAVTDPNRAPDLGRDIPAAGSRAATGPRPRRRREPLPGQVLEQRRQCPIEHFREIAGGDGVSEEVLGKA